MTRTSLVFFFLFFPFRLGAMHFADDLLLERDGVIELVVPRSQKMLYVIRSFLEIHKKSRSFSAAWL